MSIISAIPKSWKVAIRDFGTRLEHETINTIMKTKQKVNISSSNLSRLLSVKTLKNRSIYFNEQTNERPSNEVSFLTTNISISYLKNLPNLQRQTLSWFTV